MGSFISENICFWRISGTIDGLVINNGVLHNRGLLRSKIWTADVKRVESLGKPGLGGMVFGDVAQVVKKDAQLVSKTWIFDER